VISFLFGAIDGFFVAWILPFLLLYFLMVEDLVENHVFSLSFYKRKKARGNWIVFGGLISQFVWGDITFLKSYVHPYSYYKLDFKSLFLRFGKNFKFSISFTMCEVCLL
jgi:hypothetical protein